MSCICGFLTLNDLFDDLGSEIYLSGWDQDDPLFILRPKKHELEKVANLFTTKEIFKIDDIHRVKVEKGKYHLDFKNKEHKIQVRIATQASNRSRYLAHEALVYYYKRGRLFIRREACWGDLRAFTPILNETGV